ncbi:uncharacterized protein LOC132272586 [Cornus florida]|uniref:uncharacterized protein LOC132272586 n=1 Tax=Cornus florida TaxID=4283 RepID=UPI00289D039B|nr:uncharacterized protein LOC132272586 [Cornus florida]
MKEEMLVSPENVVESTEVACGVGAEEYEVASGTGAGADTEEYEVASDVYEYKLKDLVQLEVGIQGLQLLNIVLLNLQGFCLEAGLPQVPNGFGIGLRLVKLMILLYIAARARARARARSVFFFFFLPKLFFTFWNLVATL